MELTALGFDGWFEQHSAALLQPGQSRARVTAVDRGAFLIRNREAERHAELAGRFRFQVENAGDLPCVGDWVCIQGQTAGGPAVIQNVFPRKTLLRRKRPGKTVDYQLIAANIDVAFIVQSCHFDFNLQRLDRYLAMADEGKIEPRIVLSKTDLIAPEQLERTIAQIKDAGITAQIHALSNRTNCGLDQFQALLAPGRTYCLLGSSGVGKTTLINRLIGNDAFDTKAVSGTGEGVHTTSRRHLILLGCGAMLIDTPGMRELGLLGTTDAVKETFADLHDLSQNCRFSNCSHIQEPGCALLGAIENGELNEERYRSYLKLKQENKFHDLTYAEKREKNRIFGRFKQSAKKNLT